MWPAVSDEATFQALARRNIQTLAQYTFTRIVTCDPHSLHVLKTNTQPLVVTTGCSITAPVWPS